MSDTLNTRPLRGRPEYWIEYHDHRNGECDLPPLRLYLSMGLRQRWRSFTCQWSYDYKHARDTRCSCDLCRNHTDKIQKNRRFRRESKQISRHLDDY